MLTSLQQTLVGRVVKIYKCKIGKEYLNALKFKFFQQNLETFEILHASLLLNLSKLSTLKKYSFLATLYFSAYRYFCYVSIPSITE